jgi:hypothetical protein
MRKIKKILNLTLIESIKGPKTKKKWQRLKGPINSIMGSIGKKN